MEQRWLAQAQTEYRRPQAGPRYGGGAEIFVEALGAVIMRAH